VQGIDCNANDSITLRGVYKTLSESFAGFAENTE